jgi:hypothetical protein
LPLSYEDYRWLCRNGYTINNYKTLPGAIEKPVERIGGQGEREIGNDTLGLSIEFFF